MRITENSELYSVTSQQLELCDHCHRIHIAIQEDGTNTYRLYSDYAEHGDLRDLLEIHSQGVNLERQIPERFIWMIFQALADAVCALNTGKCGETLDEEKLLRRQKKGEKERKEGGKRR